MTVSDPMFLFGGAVVSALASAVAYLFADFRSTRLKVETELGECQKDRVELWKKIASMEKAIEFNQTHPGKRVEERQQG